MWLQNELRRDYGQDAAIAGVLQRLDAARLEQWLHLATKLQQGAEMPQVGSSWLILDVSSCPC